MLPDTPALILFLIATISLNLTPGPDMLYVTANSVGQGRTSGVVSALGVGGGCVFHTLAAALGLSTLLMSFPLAYEAVRYLGAGYLIYLGIKTLVGKPSPASGRPSRGTLWEVFRRGAVTNVLNPKVALFFLAFLPQFVDPSRGSAVWQFVLLGTIFNTSGTLVNTGVALVAGSLGGWMGARPRLQQVQQWFTGSVFLALGARLALATSR